MFTAVGLQNFKNFREATLDLGPFTVLVGANASGKSNLRDAFRFLHGIGRGYDFGQILDGAHGEGGENVWQEIRGGAQNISFKDAPDFNLDAQLGGSPTRRYQISVRTPSRQRSIRPIFPRLRHEQLELPETQEVIFSTLVGDEVRVRSSTSDDYVKREFGKDRPILERMTSSLHDPHTDFSYAFEHCLQVGTHFHSMRFLEFDPRALRTSSKAAQTTLGQRGENLASVLMGLCQDNAKKNTLIEWLQILTPMDAKDLQFSVAEHTNEVTLVLIEQDGTETPMQSASDGTLRFLGLLALLFQDDPPKLLFLEEIETGLHPTRLDLLVNLIEQRTQQTDTQVIATTHSPQLLEVLSQETLEDVQLVYRTGDGPEAQICPLLEVPSARRVLAKPDQRVGDLHQSGWFENAMAFSGSTPVSP